jgi:hypothetical protein
MPSAPAVRPPAAPGAVARPPVAPSGIPAAAPSAAVPPIDTGLEKPLVPQNIVTGFAPGSKEDLDAKQAYASKQIEMVGEEQRPIAKQSGESIAAIKSASANAKNNIKEYDMAEAILRKHPKAFGIGQDGSTTAAVIQLIKPGTTIPILGTIKSENIEEAIAQRRLPTEALAARAAFNSIAKRQGVEFAKNNLTGEGRGTLSNADLKMAEVAKGLDKDSPLAANLIFTILNRENEQMMLDRGNLIERHETESRRKGVAPNYSALKASPEWKKTMEDKEKRVEKRFPEFFKQGTPSGQPGKQSPADFMRNKNG